MSLALLLLLLLAPVGADTRPPTVSIDDCQLVALDGRPCSFADISGVLPVLPANGVKVVVFLGIDCPLSKLYIARLNQLASHVQILGVFSNGHDSLDEVRQFAKHHEIQFSVFRDPDQELADRLGATRITECFVIDASQRIQYSGRIDDQYLVGVQRAAATTHDLRDAIERVLAGELVQNRNTAPVGCLISRPDREPESATTFTYARDIAPLLDQNCRSCHRPGQSAPFAIETYDDARDWAETMGEQIEQNRMPPWHADSKFGHFSNDSSLTDEQKKMFAEWVDAGMPAGNLAERPRPPKFLTGWQIGEPDILVSMPGPFAVPAEGIVEYQFIEIDPRFEEDVWVSAAEVRSSNPAVVHHCNVFLLPPTGDQIVAQGTLGSVCLLANAVGTPPTTYPEGTAKLIPKGWRLQFVMHYVAVGTPQVDVTQLGLRTIAATDVQREVATRLLLDETLHIPPRVANHTVTREWKVPEDLLLLSMFPHLHLRGKSFTYELVHGNGDTEVLLHVPRYDFNWQNRYVLARPQHLPKGAILRCRATYDNSESNPFNPDPSATVRTGPHVTDEMFNGYFDVVLAEPPKSSSKMLWTFAIALAGLALVRRAVVLRTSGRT